MYDPLDALGSPTATPRGRSPSAPSEPRPGVSPLRSPTVLSLRHAPRSWSKRPPAGPRTIGPHARTQTSAVAHVHSTPAVALRCRELLCSRGPQTDSVGPEHAIAGENGWAGPSRRRRRSSYVATTCHSPPASRAPAGAGSETCWTWALRPPSDAPGPWPSPWEDKDVHQQSHVLFE